MNTQERQQLKTQMAHEAMKMTLDLVKGGKLTVKTTDDIVASARIIEAFLTEEVKTSIVKA